MTHSEDEDREAAFHHHYGCDSELDTQRPLSNSLENLKRHSHTNIVRRKYRQPVKMSTCACQHPNALTLCKLEGNVEMVMLVNHNQ